MLVKCAITAVFLLGKTNQGMGLERCLWWDFMNLSYTSLLCISSGQLSCPYSKHTQQVC